MQAQQVSYQRAVEVIRLQEPFSDDQLNEAADLWEREYGAPLVRQHEEDEEGHPTPAFRKRAREFVNNSTTGIVADPEVHRRELRKLLEFARKKGVGKLTERERAAIHENQKALKLPLMDFSSKTVKRSPKEINDAASTTYAQIVQGSATYKERAVAVRALDDVTTLQLFVELDKSEEVREIAQQRIEQVELAKVPEL